MPERDDEDEEIRPTRGKADPDRITPAVMARAMAAVSDSIDAGTRQADVFNKSAELNQKLTFNLYDQIGRLHEEIAKRDVTIALAQREDQQVRAAEVQAQVEQYKAEAEKERYRVAAAVAADLFATLRAVAPEIVSAMRPPPVRSTADITYAEEIYRANAVFLNALAKLPNGREIFHTLQLEFVPLRDALAAYKAHCEAHGIPNPGEPTPNGAPPAAAPAAAPQAE